MRASLLNGNSSRLFLRRIAGGGNSLALGSVRSPLKAQNPTKAAGFLSCKSMSTNLPAVQVKEKIDLTEKEKMIFDRLLATIRHFDLSIELRVAGDWVRNKLAAFDGESGCGELRLSHVSVLVKGWFWIPDNLDNLYLCRRGLSCLWTKNDYHALPKSSVLADKLDALLFQSSTPPLLRRNGDPLRVYMDLEASQRRSGREDIFISYHAKDDVQSTYAGSLFHNGRNYRVSSYKDNETLVYWSSSRFLAQRNELAKKLLKLLPHHSFGKCLNNVSGLDKALSFFPECANDTSVAPKWWDHLHYAMSHYKFVLAIENTWTESYVTEKLFYALDSGAVPIYFGAPSVMDFVPPHSIIDRNKFSSVEELATFVKSLANDPVAYAEYHAWRRCGVLGNYGSTRATSLDTLPCRLCECISKKGGGNAKAL
ncbi:alpha-(1,4)-fucosyltransferase-like [Syzygium oleosum]|uniref:alpha-(1,4)-fucosyltransferase-like n=1 Tax=Syzygium oleosum TaxID=219896 RepID=UPI0024B89570|nr:alpha-(1,4)-fucosyltransferase-like [Syzygium oleosum]